MIVTKKPLEKLSNGSTAKGGRPLGVKNGSHPKSPVLLRQMRWVFRHGDFEEQDVPAKYKGAWRWYTDDFKGFMGHMAKLESQLQDIRRSLREAAGASGGSGPVAAVRDDGVLLCREAIARLVDGFRASTA